MAEIKHNFLTWPWQQWAAEYPSQVAIVLGDEANGAQTFTWSEVSSHVDTFAQGLIEQGVKRDQLVAVVAANSIQVLWLILATIRIGARYVGLNPKLTETELKQQLEMLANDYIWCPDNADCSSLLGQPIELLEPETARLIPVTWQEHRPVTLTLTSGSTGLPKAVVHSAESHLANATGLLAKMTFTDQDSWLLSLPLYHISGLAIVWRWLYRGARMVIAEQSVQQQALSWVTHASLVPTQLQRFLASNDDKLHRLKQVLLGGTTIPVNLTDAAKVQGIECWTGYGMTEMGSTVAVKRADTSSGVGTVLPNRELVLREGEIYVRGKSLCLGYYRNRTIISILNSTEHDDGWFATKDLGEWHDDELFVRGRADNMFISGGENIQPEDIEQVLLQHPSVTQAFVMPVADYDFGYRPVAIVATNHRPASDISGILMDHMEQAVAPFKRPLRYFLLPENLFANGIKISRKALADWLLTQ